MSPKNKDTATKKPPLQVLRPSISNSSLNYIPDDVIEGFEERINTGISWTIEEKAARYHKQKYNVKNIQNVPFSKALQNKIKKSILNGFLDENSNFTLNEQWEILLSMAVWDNEKFSNDEGKECFNNNNSLTDNMIELIRTAVRRDDREILKMNLKMVNVLRVNDCEMTDFDESLTAFTKLSTLNLCANYITNVDTNFLPRGLRILELQNNRINNVETFVEHLPPSLLYLGLSRNILSNDGVSGLSRLPHNITVLDLSDNDICDIEMVLNALAVLPGLIALQLAGNPCAVCAAYARVTLMRLPRLQWLDAREILPTDRPLEPFEPHPDDLRSAYFNFTVFRVMSVPQPPKPDKGAVTAFHVELELPLLDSMRRKFLMFRNNESLVEMLPPPEDDDWPSAAPTPSFAESKLAVETSKLRASTSCYEMDIYNHLVAKNSREICHFTVFESNRVQWNKIMNFQEPTVKIFCPNLFALRDTFRTVITVRLVYTVTVVGKQSKPDKKSAMSLRTPGEQRVTLASIKCVLKRPDWSQPSQHFHWDDTLITDEAIHWGDGDLSILQYTLAAVKTPKGKTDSDPGSTKQFPPENLTCHFGFGIETLRL
ncbi:uncharacterized protein LOC124530931 [Vanessa cardui]|uniref:uncharacterized protein LOC124530931 n=1 Tax=Vanessa cardui TaxID=171605 RepID=UPI001F13663E|nr:uncharacterized protein LOC124530931 [Vanessa cardui]